MIFQVVQSPPKSTVPGSSRRGRPRLDPDTDYDPSMVSPGQQAMMKMKEMVRQREMAEKMRLNNAGDEVVTLDDDDDDDADPLA